MATNDRGARTYVRPIVRPVERTICVRPYRVNASTDRIEWLPLPSGGRKRSRLPRAI